VTTVVVEPQDRWGSKGLTAAVAAIGTRRHQSTQRKSEELGALETRLLKPVTSLLER